MSSKTISTFFLIATILYATTSPLADAINQTNTITVTGRVCCTATGACPAATTPGIAGAAATLNCPPLGVIATTTTDADGNFVLNVANVIVMTAACTVRIALPLTGAAATSCPLLAGVGVTAGALVSPVTDTYRPIFGIFPFFLPDGFENFIGVANGFTLGA